eukprot:GHRR01032487.1.p1 GENE.GHRR01032487.1~~GHRR01032487.1.p1  ORF type:complete len:117 (-),score=23.04 GHRR01032487.1:317-667(-)
MPRIRWSCNCAIFAPATLFMFCCHDVLQVVAQHKERWVFPVTIAVTKVSGAGADAVYMGVLKPAAQDSESVKVWISPGGTVWCVDSRFADWFGTSPADCVNKPFSTLGVEPDKLEG